MPDLLFTNARILTMDAQATQYESGFVAVQGSKVSGVGQLADLPDHTSATQVIDCSNCVLLPGLINTHTHQPMVYFRGMADDITLMDWLTKHIWPAEAKFLSADFVYQASLLAAAESIKGGVTTINDMYPFAMQVGKACADAGLRAFVGEGVVDAATPSGDNWQAQLSLAQAVFSEFRGHPLVTATACAHAPYSCSIDLLQAVHSLAQENGALFHLHLHETQGEPDMINWSGAGKTPTQALKGIGVLGPKLVAAHGVWLNGQDIKLLRDNNCAVAHCPSSNLKLGSGIAPVHNMVEAGLTVGVGTDGAASNNNLNLWEELTLAAMLAKGRELNPEVIPAQTALRFATSAAAKVLCCDSIGSIETGKQADLIVVELGGLNMVPLYPHGEAIYSQLVYSAQASGVRDTVVAGKILMRKRELLTLDEAELCAKAQEWIAENFGN